MTTAGRLSRNSARALIAAGLIAIACVPALAHRRDEYLQAARIAVDPQRVQIELDITPGIAVASGVVAEIDRDRDGLFGPAETRAYAARVLAGLALELDGARLPFDAIDTQFPDAPALLGGEGTIRVTLVATLAAEAKGLHRILFRNDHHPGGAAYLANALAPASPRIAIGAQRRDPDQREIVVEYTLDGAADAGRPWPLAAGLAVEIAIIAGIGLVWRRSGPLGPVGQRRPGVTTRTDRRSST
jgi:hypothetical protein